MNILVVGWVQMYVIFTIVPECCQNDYGCNEGDQRSGVAHTVNLPEHREVVCLWMQREKHINITFWIWCGTQTHNLCQNSHFLLLYTMSPVCCCWQNVNTSLCLDVKPALTERGHEVYLSIRAAVITEGTGVLIRWIHFRPAVGSAVPVNIAWGRCQQQRDKHDTFWKFLRETFIFKVQFYRFNRFFFFVCLFFQ